MEVLRKSLISSRASRILADMEPLSVVLKKWRELARLTKAEAARTCDMSQVQWTELETGVTSDPRSSTLRKLSLGTGIHPDVLTEAAHAERLVGATG